jgi:Kdo2-lipid IVA lauroyltransferase/acyltransferase
MTIFFYVFKLFAWFVSRLPFPVLYFLSGIVRFFLHYIIRYRRAIILSNLHRSFPEKSRAEIKKIMSRYYRNLADIFLEVIKLERIQPDELKKRFKITGFEHMAPAFNNGRSVILAFGHCGNWEWMAAVLGLVLPVKGFGVVKPLADKNFHKYLESLRHRFNPDGTIPFQHTYRALIRNKKEMVSLTGIAADQTPTRAEINYWINFLNQDTPFYMGVEKLAKSLDLSVFYMDIRRTGRGMYRGDIQPVTNDPKNTAEFEITDKYIRMLENTIRHQPDNWLWSHRRWKFERQIPEAGI